MSWNPVCTQKEYGGGRLPHRSAGTQAAALHLGCQLARLHYACLAPATAALVLVASTLCHAAARGRQCLGSHSIQFLPFAPASVVDQGPQERQDSS
jgi:hypothetical protein